MWSYPIFSTLWNTSSHQSRSPRTSRASRPFFEERNASHYSTQSIYEAHQALHSASPSLLTLSPPLFHLPLSFRNLVGIATPPLFRPTDPGAPSLHTQTQRRVLLEYPRISTHPFRDLHFTTPQQWLRHFLFSFSHLLHSISVLQSALLVHTRITPEMIRFPEHLPNRPILHGIEHCLPFFSDLSDPDQETERFNARFRRHLEWEGEDGTNTPMDHCPPEKWIALQWVFSRRPSLADGILFACSNKIGKDDKEKLHLYGYFAGQYAHRALRAVDWKTRILTWDTYSVASIYLRLWKRFFETHLSHDPHDLTSSPPAQTLPKWCNQCTALLHRYTALEWENRPENATHAAELWDAFLHERTLEDWIEWEHIHWK